VSCTELTVYVLSRDTYHQGAVSVVAACQEVCGVAIVATARGAGIAACAGGRFKARVWLVPALPPLV